MQSAVVPQLPNRLHPPHFEKPTYLMCPPHWYDVNYVINPWMAGNLHRPSRDRAFEQWRALYEKLHELADVRVMQAQPGSPDMVFVAHAAAVQHGVAALSSFAHAQRQAEEEHLRTWLEAAGFLIWETPRETSFEGEGDAIFDGHERLLWVAHGVRTCECCHLHLASAWHIPVRSLHLIDPRFYHLDTCFAPLSEGHLLYFPQAFDQSSRAAIEAIYPAERRIAVSEADAARFACNVIDIRGELVMGKIGEGLAHRLEAAGYRVTQLDMSEFLRGGGSAKSMALRLSEAPAMSVQPDA